MSTWNPKARRAFAADVEQLRHEHRAILDVPTDDDGEQAEFGRRTLPTASALDDADVDHAAELDTSAFEPRYRDVAQFTHKGRFGLKDERAVGE